MKRPSTRFVVSLLAIAMCAPAALSQESDTVKAGTESDVNAIGNRKVGHGPDMYSIQREIALGKQLSEEVEKVSKLIQDPVIVGYVNKVGQNLVRNSDAEVPFTIKVIDDEHFNAFALPGGFFYVNTGVILTADNEAELAGVMGHEIAHVAARHQTRNATKANIMQIASIPLIMTLPGTWTGYGIYEGLNFAIPMTYLKFGRDAEREADYLGIQYMYKAGYDPNMFVMAFEKVEAEEKKQPGTIPKIFDTHPPTPDRIIAAQKEIATILPPRPEYIVDTSEFDTVKARLQRLEMGERIQAGRDKPSLKSKQEQQKDAQNQQQQGQTGDENAPVLKRRPN
jgi:beta-barrel assembly-enhancing protease